MILKILNYIFVTLGIFFFILIIGLVAFVVVDPLDLKPLFFRLSNVNFNIEKAVVEFEKEVTPEKINCFVGALGEKRAQEIVGGATLEAGDILKAKHCLTK
jgi:hypothetical protein